LSMHILVKLLGWLLTAYWIRYAYIIIIIEDKKEEKRWQLNCFP